MRRAPTHLPQAATNLGTAIPLIILVPGINWFLLKALHAAWKLIQSYSNTYTRDLSVPVTFPIHPKVDNMSLKHLVGSQKSLHYSNTCNLHLVSSQNKKFVPHYPQ